MTYSNDDIWEDSAYDDLEPEEIESLAELMESNEIDRSRDD